LLKFSGGGLLECYVELELCRRFGRAASDRKLDSLRPECANASDEQVLESTGRTIAETKAERLQAAA
jgi:hypothetical protein